MTSHAQTSQNEKQASTQPQTVRENVTDELSRLRDNLTRIAHDVRMKSKGASAEVKATRDKLEKEVERFSADVEKAADETKKDLMRVGQDLQMRFEKLANQVVSVS